MVCIHCLNVRAVSFATAPTVISTDRTTLSYPESGIAVFRCDAETDPSTPLDIQWLHSMCSSSSNPYPSYSTYHENEQDVRLVNYSSLQLDLDEMMQIGGSGTHRKHCINYTCFASNGLTSAVHVISLPLNGDDVWRAVPQSDSKKDTYVQSGKQHFAVYV